MTTRKLEGQTQRLGAARGAGVLGEAAESSAPGARLRSQPAGNRLLDPWRWCLAPASRSVLQKQ